MIARLVISPSIETTLKEINKTLSSHLSSGNTEHPDLLYFEQGRKLGTAEAKQIKEHFSLKPYSAKGKAVVIEDVSVMTVEAQNALLKTLEELPAEAIFILGANSDANLLPTILSRCEIYHFQDDKKTTQTNYKEDVIKLLNSTTEERFNFVEKLKDREEFLLILTAAFREMLYAPRTGFAKLETVNFLKELLQAEEWAKQNVNIRAILEYLMLKMPSQS